MAFRLPLVQLKRGFAAVAKAQLSHFGSVASRKTSILEQRKSLKKLRALLSLVETAGNQKSIRTCDRTLRKTSRKLGPARDAGALLETLNRLAQAGHLARQSLARPSLARPSLERVLRKKLGRDAAGDKVSVAAVDVAALAVQIAAIDLGQVKLRTLVDAASRSYRMARRGLALAGADRTSVTAHEWRKTVQRHARHLQLLADLWPADLEMRTAVAKQMARDLGEDHDLHLFAEWLISIQVPQTERRAVVALRAAIADQQRRLRADARAHGAKLFAERPRHFQRRLAVYARHHKVIKITRDAG